MTDTSNRTFVCSVLFLDIAEYSKKPVAEQLTLKQRFNALLVDAMKHVATADRIVLDTGDGAAVSFLGNPEDCLFAAMALRDGIAAEGPDLQPPLQVRIGINLGPVRLLKDINGQLNIIGDGINVAQRIMSFAELGSILVSRSYYEVVSCLSEDFAGLFEYHGTRTDKHVREHSVYFIAPGTNIKRPAATRGPAMQPSARVAPNEAVAASTGAGTPPDGQPALETEHAAGAEAKPAAASSPKRLIAAAAAAAILLGGAVLARRERPADAPPPAAAPEPVAAAEQTPPPPAPPTEKPEPAKPAEPANVAVSLAILPWGEVYVDGRMAGVSPPLKNLTLSPGKHRIEIRNSTFPPLVQNVDDATGKKIKIRHKFQ